MQLKQILMCAVIATALTTSCKKEGCTDPAADNYNSAANDNDGSCEYTGQVSFWMNTGDNYVDVTVAGITSTITTNYGSNPGCGQNGCANFTLPSGNYNYSAIEDAIFFPTSWGGTLTVPKNDCLTLQLTF